MNPKKTFCKSELHGVPVWRNDVPVWRNHVNLIFKKTFYIPYLHIMSKEKEIKLARILYVDQGKTAKEVATVTSVHEKTVGAWVEKYNWKVLRDAKANSPDLMVINIKDLLRSLAEERMELDAKTDLDESQKSKRKAKLADEASKWTKALEAAQNESRVPLGTYLNVMDKIFDAIRDAHPKLYMELLDFQERHINQVASQYE